MVKGYITRMTAKYINTVIDYQKKNMNEIDFLLQNDLDHDDICKSICLEL